MGETNMTYNIYLNNNDVLNLIKNNLKLKSNYNKDDEVIIGEEDDEGELSD